MHHADVIRHARRRGQVCTYDTADLDHSAGSLAQLAYSLNQLLPDDVCVMRAAHV